MISDTYAVVAQRVWRFGWTRGQIEVLRRCAATSAAAAEVLMVGLSRTRQIVRSLRGIGRERQSGSPHFRVRVVIPGAVLHLASWDEPKVELSVGGWIAWVDADWIDDPAYGDKIGHIAWREVKAITWRRPG